MEGKITRSAYLARVISRITNPCFLSILVLLLIAFAEPTNIRVVVGWVTVVFLFLAVLPLGYVYMRTSRGRSVTKLLVKPTVFLKQHPIDILILGLLSGLPCLVILLFLEAPLPMLYTLAALLASSIVTALFNIFYRVSYHLAAVTILLIMTAQTWGPVLLVLLAAIPLIGWAKYQLQEHTPVQLAIGFVLSVAVSGATLYLFGQIPVL